MSKWMRKVSGTAAALALTVITVVAAACGGGGGDAFDPGPSSPTPSGKVALTIKDAPLSELATFTIDISAAVLKGAGNADAPIFPGPNSAPNATVTVDLLAAQAFGVLLSSASVPVGNYYAIELTYANPQAVTIANVVQTVQHSGNTLSGMFAPPLAVSANSTQTVQVDVDLSNSVVDLGPTALFLAPVVRVDVLNQATPVQRLSGQVTSIDVLNDRFTADLLFYGANSARGGSITVQCSSTTGFKNGSTTTTGNVAAQLVSGDFVQIDGTLLNNVIDATLVAKMPNMAPSTGIGGAFPGGQPRAYDISGTITAVNTTSGELTMRVNRSFGPGATRPTAGSSFTVSVTSTTTLSRGPMIQTLGDFEPGNSVQCWADLVGTTWEALDITEGPAYVTGTVVSLQAGLGANGDDLLTFDLVAVEGTPIANFTFLPTTMTADMPTGSNLAANASVGLVGFFDGSSHFDAFGRAQPGPGGPGAPGGGNWFPGPITLPQPGHHVSGMLAASTTATQTAAGVEFDLDPLRFNTPTTGLPSTPSSLIRVTVTSAATIRMMGNTGAMVNLTLAQAVTEINGNPGALIEAEGSAAQVGNAFTCDVSLTLLKVNVHIPGNPGGGGGSTGPGGPFPGPIGPNLHVENGIVTASTTATEAAGVITFSLDAHRFTTQPWPITAPTTQTLTVTVPVGASLTLVGVNTASNLTVAQAVAELNLAASDPNVMVEVVGTAAASTNAFTADVSLAIWLPMPPPNNMLYGTVTASTTATENNGDVTFSLDSGLFGRGNSGPSTSTTPVIVTVTSAATMEKFDGSATGWITLTAVQAAAELTAIAGDPNSWVEVEGSAAGTTTTFTADVRLTIYVMPTQPPIPGPGPGPGPNPGMGFMTGTVVGTANVNANGEIEFTLARPNATNVAVTVTATAILMLIDTRPPVGLPGPGGPGGGNTFPGTGLQMLTVAQAVAELNANPLGVDVAGTFNAVTNTFIADNSLTIIK